MKKKHSPLNEVFESSLGPAAGILDPGIPKKPSKALPRAAFGAEMDPRTLLLDGSGGLVVVILDVVLHLLFRFLFCKLP